MIRNLNFLKGVLNTVFKTYRFYKIIFFIRQFLYIQWQIVIIYYQIN